MTLMRRLILLRHAKSSWDSPLAGDFERVLDARGIADAASMGRYLAHERLMPDRVLVSTAHRTRQTWGLIAPHLPNQPDVQFDSRIYEAPAATLLGVVQENLEDAATLLLIGHNPGLQGLALHLAKHDNSAYRRRLEAKYPTCGLLILDFLFLDWADILPDTGIIERFESPKTLGFADQDE